MLEKIRPRAEDRKRLKEAAGAILARIEGLSRERGHNFKALLVGSAARSTWLAGDHDLDIFIAVPDGSDLKDALALARLVAPVHQEKYAEHAYIHAIVDGFDVDLVPCYQVENASCLRSAVDRTPFHTQYISSRIAGLEDHVLLLKQFMKGVGVYGSELRTGGFSGYLSEILVLRYGSFLGVLEAASGWRPGETIDLEGRGAQAHNEPLVVVDPVDPYRNVAAALTLDKMFEFVAASRCYLARPELEMFFSMGEKPLTDQEIIGRMRERGSHMLLVEFKAPDVVEDVLFPQLRKAEESAHAMLDRHGFRALRSDVYRASGLAGMLFELEVAELPTVSKRVGPPAWEGEHLSRFLSAHIQKLSGPYMEGGHAVVEVRRKYTMARDLLDKEITSLALGKHIAVQIKAGYRIYYDIEILEVKDPEFRTFLAGYFKARQKLC